MLIVLAARGDLWLDEIWSFNFAYKAKTIAEIFNIRHDNNHVLNTIYLFFIKEQSAFIIYRLFAVLSGIGSIFLIGYIAKRNWGYYEAFCSVTLSGLSYPLLIYFSEARGYAPAIFFSLLSYTILSINLVTFKWYRLILFWLASFLGILSHPTFIIIYLALFMMNLAFILQAKHQYIPGKIFTFLLHQTLPLLSIITWYLFFIRYIQIGGGAIFPKFEVILRTVTYLFGAPNISPFPLCSLIAMLIIVLGGTISLEYHNKTQGLFFLCALIISPVFLIVIIKPEILYFRYFIVCFPFFYLLLSYSLCKCFKLWSKPYKFLLALFIILTIAGQSKRIYFFLALNRGNYSSALEYILKKSSSSPITVGSDHNFRNGTLIDFYAPLISKNKKLLYVDQAKWNKNPPEWIILHRLELSYKPPEKYSEMKSVSYRLEGEYRYSGISGWNWFLYRREDTFKKQQCQ
jgi:hypothetical protein